jgi:phosphoserine phosphatase RsbU/P
MAQEPTPLPDALSALQDAPCGFLQTDDEGLILWVNRTFCSWLGFDSEELVAKRRLQDLFTMGGRIFHQTHWSPLLRMQGSIAEVKLEIVTKDGAKLPVIVNAIRREVGGHLIQEVALYVARDRDKYEQELLLSRRKVEEAVTEAQRLQEEAKDRASFAEQMIGIVSHDLRNPLSAIHMGAFLLAKTNPTPNQVTVLGRITRSTDRANRLISELLDFTQARLGKGLSVSLQPVQLQALVHDSVDELKMAFPSHVLQHEHVGGDDSCEADPDRLAQLIGNLVANAAAYGDQAQPITVRSRVDTSTFAVGVHNFGKPIAPEWLETIFLPLARGEKANASGRSVGLGLYIVSEIAKAHGGQVAVRSGEGSGTEFEAVLPRR